MAVFNHILRTTISTPIGRMYGCATQSGICLLEFEERNDLERQFRNLQEHLKMNMVPGQNMHLLNLQLQLDEYFRKERTVFDLPLITSGTPFQEKVWEALAKIPFGHTVTYKALTAQLGDPAAIRAVAAAVAANKIAILIPCHRVIGSDGKLVGYAGGLWRKKYLLELERGEEKSQLSLKF